MFFGNHEVLSTTPARRLALEVAERAMQAVLPEALIPRALEAVIPLPPVWLFGAGKAAAGMAAAAETTLTIKGGAVITVPGAAGQRPSDVEVLHGEHPVPGSGSLKGTARLLELASQVGPDDTVLWLISGGASALLCAPAPSITLGDKQTATRLLVHGGATIDDINAVRKHLSAVKGGLLARRFAPARVITLALSDVISGRLDVIGSGPTVPDPSTFRDAMTVIEHHRLGDQIPPAVIRHLRAGTEGRLPETPKPGEPCFQGATTQIIGSPGTSAAAAARAAREHLGVHAEVLTDQLAGDARSVAATLGGIYRYWAQAQPARPQVIIAAGETTVTVSGDGEGGRCQELAAALIPELDGLPGCAVACVATDGQDYIEGAGGAMVDGETAALARRRGLRVNDYLKASNTNALHRALGTLIESRPTGTNVCDLVIAVLNAAP